MTATAFIEASPVGQEAEPAPPIEPPPIEEHVSELGFDSILQYRLWCHGAGFGSGLDKDEEQRQAEREAARQRPRARHYSGRRRQMHERFIAGELDASCVSGRMGYIYQALQAPGDDVDARQALLSLVLRIDFFVDVTDTRRVLRAGPHRRLQHGLAQLACHHRRWIRPLDS